MGLIELKSVRPPGRSFINLGVTLVDVVPGKTLGVRSYNNRA
jgi:hypothetical protein